MGERRASDAVADRSSTPSTPRGIPSWRDAGLLAHRLVGFAVFQGLIAACYAALGDHDAWASSVAWWPLAAAGTSLTTLVLLIRASRRDGRRIVDLFRPRRDTLWRDLGATLGVAVVASIAAVGPNVGLAAMLFGSADPLDTLIRPLPAWAAIATVAIFPVSIGLTELAFYFGYLRERIEAETGRGWPALGLTAGFLALQHATLPLVFDWAFVTWRALMFLPLALVMGGALAWRPRLLPYLAIFHALADLQIALMVLEVSV